MIRGKHPPATGNAGAAMTRRDLLGAGAGAAAWWLLPGCAAVSPGDAGRGSSTTRPRRIIFLVADGMSVGSPSMTEPFARQWRAGATAWWRLAADARCVRGWVDTASHDSLVTDSAAAATAWSTGVRVNNGQLSTAPDGRPLVPLGRRLKAHGWRVGLVTTTTITHATPAAFAAVADKRNDEAALATQLLDGADVLMGGGREFFDAEKRADHRDVMATYRASGFHVSTDFAALPATPQRRLLGLFSPRNLPYRIDRAQGEAAPTLAQMAAAAMSHLGNDPFFLLLEGARVDHAAHANDAASMLREQLDFDDALAAVLDRYADDDHTLVVATTDHGTGNPGLCGMGRGYVDSEKALQRLTGFRESFETLQHRIRASRPDAATIGQVIADATSLTLTEPELSAVTAAARNDFTGVLSQQVRSLAGVLGQVVGNHTGVNWITTRHTSDRAPFLAIGAGAGRLARARHHTEVFDAMAELAGLS